MCAFSPQLRSAPAAENVRIGTRRLPEITEAMANEARDLPGLVQQTQISMREMERLAEALQRHWLLRKYVNKTDPPHLAPQSEVQGSAHNPLTRPSPPKGWR